MRDRSQRIEREAEIEDQLPRTFVDEDGIEWTVTRHLVKLQGIKIIETNQELLEDLITYGVNERFRVAIARIAFAFIRRSYLAHPTSDDVLLARTNATSHLILGPIYDAIEEEYQREVNPSAFTGKPPRSGEFLISFFTPREKRDEIIGSLAAYYTDMEEEYGSRVAHLLYWKEVARSLGPILARFVEWLLKYRVLSSLGELIRHLQHH